MRNTQIIAVANQKGGVGKTTTTHNLGTALARKGKKVLMLDIDPQSNLTMCMGFQNPDELPYTMAHILKGLISETFILPKEKYILHSEGCDLIPSSIQLSGIEPSLISAMSRENIIKRFLKQIKDDYDVILIDCMPSLGMLTINALTAATSVLIPVQAHYLSAKGLEMLISTVAKIKRNINPGLRFNGILITMHNERLNFSKSILNDLKAAYGEHIKIYKTTIPQSVKAVENTAVGQSLFRYDPRCKVALAYEAFAQEVIDND